MRRLSANFTAQEFACPCCGSVAMNQSTINRLQQVRDKYNKPIAVVPGGGFRCRDYDKGRSAHKTGEAVDVGIPKSDMYAFIRIAMKCGFTGLGVKNHNGRWQIHIDDACDIPGIRPRPFVWTYP